MTHAMICYYAAKRERDAGGPRHSSGDLDAPSQASITYWLIGPQHLDSGQ